MIKLDYVPEGIDDIKKYYGTPEYLDDEGNAHVNLKWYEENILFFKLPFPLRLSWNQKQIRGFIAHKKVGLAMVDALEEIESYGGLQFLQKYNLDQWGGVYNHRYKRSATGTLRELSTHAWGIAKDYCPDLGPLGEKSRMPCFIVEAFVKRGFINLWMHDGQHQQAAKGY